MSVIPVSALSPGELRLLGNNLIHRRRRILTAVKLAKAVNRSLARLGEEVKRLHPRQLG